MKRRPPEIHEFVPPDWGRVVAAMAELQAGRSGWINLQPDLDDAARAVPPSGIFGALANRGPVAPLCTWHPGEAGRRGTTPASVGIQHATGTKAARRLADAGHPVPPGWKAGQDHPRRGLVVTVPDGESPETVLRWLVGAGAALCPEPVTRWTAMVHRP